MENFRNAPIGESLASALRAEIFNGDLQPGESLNQEELAARFDVSRMPVRAALQTLKRDGLITVGVGNRAVVVAMSPKEIRDHYGVRALLESESASLAARSGDATAIRLANDEAKRASEQGDAAAYVVANERLHRAIWTASGNRWLIMSCSQLWTGISPHTPSILPSQMGKSILEHEALIDAIERQDSDCARAAMAMHILNAAAAVQTHWKEEPDLQMKGDE